ncbi:MAG: LptA/OstA family protein [Syntrophales bacterium]|nr:LptA/OstA family protein [Syntrophales bacterium]
MKKRFLLLLFVAILPLAAGGSVYGAESPIRITSDRLDAYDDKALVLFSGKVVATQDDAVMRADELYLYYDKKNGDKSVPPSVTMTAGKVKRIELRGNVNMKKGERTVTGDGAVFHNADQTVVVTGNAVMREGDNVIAGDKITVFMNENRGIVESSSNKKRVTATIYPEDNTRQAGKRKQ